MCKVEVVNLTEDRLEEALAVFKRDGWQETTLTYVEAEMRACLRGDIPGYVRARFVVAIADGQVIGAAAWTPSMCGFAVYELSWATVLPEWRRRGVNKLMLQQRVQEIRKFHGSGMLSVLVCTWDNAMYRQAGFKPMPTEGVRDSSAKCMLLAQF